MANRGSRVKSGCSVSSVSSVWLWNCKSSVLRRPLHRGHRRLDPPRVRGRFGAPARAARVRRAGALPGFSGGLQVQKSLAVVLPSDVAAFSASEKEPLSTRAGPRRSRPCSRRSRRPRPECRSRRKTWTRSGTTWRCARAPPPPRARARCCPLSWRASPRRAAPRRPSACAASRGAPLRERLGKATAAVSSESVASRTDASPGLLALYRRAGRDLDDARALDCARAAASAASARSNLPMARRRAKRSTAFADDSP